MIPLGPCVCVCVCARACVCVCVCVYARVRVRACVRRAAQASLELEGPHLSYFTWHMGKKMPTLSFCLAGGTALREGAVFDPCFYTPPQSIISALQNPLTSVHDAT